MTDNAPRTIIGTFESREDAVRAIDALHRANFGPDGVGVASRDGVPEGIGVGMVAGGGMGALAGIALGSAAVTPVGPIVAGGILAGILGSTVLGASVGGLIGGLVGLGVPEEEARLYEGELKAGRTIVAVRADGRSAEARALLHRCGAFNLRDDSDPLPAGSVTHLP
jgi:hypothetical protein